MLFVFREIQIPLKSLRRSDARVVYKSALIGLKDLLKNNRNVALFLIAFSLISDGILTIQTYFALVMDAMYKIPDTQKYLVTIVMFIPMIIGNYTLGRVGDKIGHKPIMFWSCLVVSILMALVLLSSSVTVLYVLAAFLGIGWGGFYVASRALMVKISPKERLGEYFGFYSSFYRFASIVGPLVWGITTLSLKTYGVFKYQIAGFMIIALMAVGIYVLTKVREEANMEPKSV
jgi:UMF1 family MFS transporter